jgi:hypothetical protein
MAVLPDGYRHARCANAARRNHHAAPAGPLTAHLRQPRTQRSPAGDAPTTGEVDRSLPITADDDLVERARQEDARHWAIHQRPISAETLRKRLHIGVARSRGTVQGAVFLARHAGLRSGGMGTDSDDIGRYESTQE